MTRVRRSRDPGGDWSGRVRAARSAGAEAIVYLNRYEGITSEGSPGSPPRAGSGISTR